MRREVWTTGEIEVDVWGFFTTHHRLQTELEVLGEITLSSFSGGVFHSVDGRDLVLARTSWWRGWHELRENGIVLGTSRPEGFWQRTTRIGFRGKMYWLEPAGFWSRGWHLTDGAGTVLLDVQPRGLLRRGAYLTIVGSVHADLLVFAYYLVNVRWQEQSAAASAAATGS